MTASSNHSTEQQITTLKNGDISMPLQHPLFSRLTISRHPDNNGQVTIELASNRLMAHTQEDYELLYQLNTQPSIEGDNGETVSIHDKAYLPLLTEQLSALDADDLEEIGLSNDDVSEALSNARDLISRRDNPARARELKKLQHDFNTNVFDRIHACLKMADPALDQTVHNGSIAPRTRTISITVSENPTAPDAPASHAGVVLRILNKYTSNSKPLLNDTELKTITSALPNIRTHHDPRADTKIAALEQNLSQIHYNGKHAAFKKRDTESIAKKTHQLYLEASRLGDYQPIFQPLEKSLLDMEDFWNNRSNDPKQKWPLVLNPEQMSNIYKALATIAHTADQYAQGTFAKQVDTFAGQLEKYERINQPGKALKQLAR